MSTEIIEQAISMEEAQRIDQRIRLKIDHAKDFPHIATTKPVRA